MGYGVLGSVSGKEVTFISLGTDITREIHDVWPLLETFECFAVFLFVSPLRGELRLMRNHSEVKRNFYAVGIMD